eukprot:TRINITY_DN2059_c0_g1_i1.p1 TRINITY_DN2059_c0_g1~~TRINITY_DN2059_c0_g1_i1.p1  ORF type:complete len:442 (-),score=35.91 TRINITY_DN2059_c0_g1_i1:56-1381(-)
MISTLKPTISVFVRAASPSVDQLVDKLLVGIKSTFSPLNVVPQFNLYRQEHLSPTDLPPTHRTSQYHICLMATGGTEGLCLEYASLVHKRSPEKPIIILTHPDMNSFAAGLEAKAKLTYESKPVHLFHIPDFTEIDTLFKVLRARENLTQEGKQVGIIGEPSEWLVASNLETIGTKTEVWGIRIMDDIIDWKELLETYKSIPENTPEVNEVAKYFADRHCDCLGCVPERIEEKPIRDNSRLCVALKQLSAKYNLHGLTLRCFDLIAHNITGCLAVSYLNDIGIPSACEGDIPSMITMMLAHSVSGLPSFMANPIHYEGKKLSLAHCTIPTKMTQKYSLRTHFESGKGMSIQGDVTNADKPWTLSRANLWENEINCEEVMVQNVTFKSEHRCRTQVEAEFSSEERLRQFIQKMSGNHHILTAGSWKKPLELYKKLFVRQWLS